MVRDTSIEAYKDLIDSDILGRKHKIILEALIRANKDSGPITASELFAEYLRSRNLVFSNIRARLGELRDMEAIEERDKRLCNITGKRVITWHFTGRKPQKVNRISKEERKLMIKDFMSTMLANTQCRKTKSDIKILWKMVKEL